MEPEQIIDQIVEAADKEVAEYDSTAMQVLPSSRKHSEEEAYVKSLREIPESSREGLTQAEIERIKQHELDVLNQKSQALKQYISDNV